MPGEFDGPGWRDDPLEHTPPVRRGTAPRPQDRPTLMCWAVSEYESDGSLLFYCALLAGGVTETGRRRHPDRPWMAWASLSVDGVTIGFYATEEQGRTALEDYVRVLVRDA